MSTAAAAVVSAGPSWSVQSTALSSNSELEGVFSSVYCIPAPFSCSISNIPAVSSTSPISPTGFQWGAGTTNTFTCPLGYGFTSQFIPTFSLPCQIDIGGTPDYTLPACIPQSCPALASFVNGTWSAETGVTGDDVAPECVQGTFPVYTTYTCTGQTPSPPYPPGTIPPPGGAPDYHAASAWCGSGTGTNTVPCTPIPALPCQVSITPSFVLTATVVDQYSYLISFVAPDLSNLQPPAVPSGFDPTTVDYRVEYNLLFPRATQLSSSNALEAGLLSKVTNTTTSFVINATQGVTSYSAMIYNDVNRHIEGVFSEIVVTPFVPPNPDPAIVPFDLNPETAFVQSYCGCYASNPNGNPVSAAITQDFTANNDLSLSFLPQSLCTSDYKLTHFSPVSTTYQDAGLPILETYYADSVDECPFISMYTTPIAVVNYSITGRVQTYCVQPLPMQICEACDPVYTPATLTASGNVPDITECLSFVPSQWFLFSGVVNTPVSSTGPSVQSAVGGVTLTVSIVDGTGNLLSVSNPNVNGGASSSITGSVASDVTGAWSYQLASNLLTQQYYNLAVTPSRVDTYTIANPTLVSLGSAYQGTLISIQPGTTVLLDLGSTQTVTQLNTTSLTITYSYNCPAQVYPNLLLPCANASTTGCVTTKYSQPTAAQLAGVANLTAITNSSDPAQVPFGSPTQIGAVNGSAVNASLQAAVGVKTNPATLACTLANAFSVLTIATYNHTTVTTTSATRYSYPVGGLPPVRTTNSTSVVSSVQSVRWLSYLNLNLNGSANNLSAPLNTSQAAALLSALQPHLVDAHNRLIVGGVDALTGHAPAAALTIVIPAGYPLGCANLTTAPNATNITASSSKSTPVVTSLASNVTVVNCTAISNFPMTYEQGSAEIGLYVGLSNGLALVSMLTEAILVDLSPSSANTSSFNATFSQPFITNSPQNGLFPLSSPIRLTVYGPQPYTTTSVVQELYLEQTQQPVATSITPSQPYSLAPLTYQAQLVHQFSLEGVYPATNTLLVPATHAQQFTQIVFNDLSEIAVAGQIRVAPNTILPGIESCGQPSVVVSAYSVLDTSFVSPLSIGAPTLADGSFTIAVPAQQNIVLVPQFYNTTLATHSFLPANLPLSVGVTPIAGLLFFDTTTSGLTAQISGGDQCAFPVGVVSPVVVVDSCGGEHFTLGGFGSAPFTYQLPAIQYTFISYTADPLDRSGLQQPTDGSMPLSYLETLNAWLVNNGNFDLDLRSAPFSFALDYVNQTNIVVLPPTTPLQCTDATYELPFNIWQQGSTQTVSFQLSQSYGYGSSSYVCNALNTTTYSVWVHDEINANPSLPCAATGCQLTSYYDGTYTKTNYTLQVGDPYPFTRLNAPAYTRDLRYGQYGSLNEEAITLSVLVTGSVVYSGVGSVPYAPQDPLYILRDPPGGGSSATVTSVTTNTAVSTYSNGFIGAVGVQLATQYGTQLQTAVCTGIGAAVCNTVLQAQATTGDKVATLSTSTVNQQNQNTQTQTYTTTVTTSTDPAIVGGMGDLFLLVTASLDFSLAIVVQASFNPAATSPATACTVTAPYESLTWSMSPNNYLTWVAVSDIVTLIIPQTQTAIQTLIEGNDNSNNFADPDDFAVYADLCNAVAAWNGLIEYNNQLKATAVDYPDLADTLLFNDPIVDSTLYNNPDFNNNTVPYQSLGGGNELNGQTAISLYGDTGSLTFSVLSTVTQTSSVIFSEVFATSTQVSFITELVAFATTAINLQAQVTGSLSYTHGFENDATQTYSNTVSFTLSDPNIGDNMQILVKQDPVYGSPVYVLQSGYSRCAPEPPIPGFQGGTLSRENVTMQFVQTSFSGQNPNTAGSTTVVLTSYAPLKETFGYYLNVNTETNQGGLQLFANGQPMLQNSVFLNLPYGPTYVSLSWQRGPGTGYNFPNVSFTLSGNSASCTSPLKTTESISVQYVQPCNQVAWAGDLAYSSSFVVNLVEPQLFGSTGTHYVMVITNPESAIEGRAWEDNPTLQSISIQYKGIDDNDAEWTPLQTVDSTDTQVDFLPITNSQPVDIYAFYAYVGNLNGQYDFRVVTQCAVPGGGADTLGLYSYSTPVVTGLIDHNYPALFGTPLPGVSAQTGVATYYPGDPIQATFTEDIVCQSAHSQLQVFAWVVNASAPGYANSPYHIQTQYLCGANTIDLAFLYPQWDLLIGQQVAVEVLGYVDLGGNPADPTLSPLTWTFRVAYFNVQQSLIQASGLSFSPSSISLAGTIAAADGPTAGGSSTPTGGGARRRLLQTSTETTSNASSTGMAVMGILPTQTITPTLTPADPVSGLVSLSSIPPNASVLAAIAAELPLEVVAAIDLQRAALKLGASRYLPSLITVTSQTAPSVTMAFSFLPSTNASVISPSAASAYFATALLNPTLTAALSNPSIFPMLAFSQIVQAVKTNKTSTTAAQSYNYNLALNPQPIGTSALPPAGFVPAKGTTPPTYPSGGATQSSTAANTFTLGPSGMVTASVALPLSVPMANATLAGVIVTYTPEANTVSTDPDVIAETVYPTTTLNTSAVSASGGQYYLYPTATTAAHTSAFLLGLNSIPTIPGGEMYHFTVVNASHAAAGQAALYSGDVFVNGPPCAPLLLAVTQTALSTFQLAYLASPCNGQKLNSGNVNMTYPVNVQQPGASGTQSATTLPVPAAALSSAYSSTPLSNVTIPQPLPTIYCPPSVSYMTVALNSQPGFVLPTAGLGVAWNVSINAAIGSVMSTLSTLPVTVSAVPAQVNITSVIPVALNRFAVYWTVPSSAAPLQGYKIGYSYTSAGPVVTDPMASAPANITPTALPNQMTATINIPFPQAPLSQLYLSVQAYNAIGSSVTHLHQMFAPGYVAPPASIFGLQQLQAEGGTQSVQVSWTGSPLFVPSATQALGYELLTNTTAPVVMVSNITRTAVISGIPLSSPAVIVGVGTVMNSTNNTIKLCTPGAVQPVASQPLQSVFRLTQPPNAPTSMNVVQTSATTATVTFLPSDYQAPATGPATIQRYRASYMAGVVSAAAYNSSALPNASMPAVPTQTTTGPSSTASNTVLMSGLRPSSAGAAMPTTFGVQARNIAGFGMSAVQSIAILGVPSAPNITIVQTDVHGVNQAALTVIVNLTGTAPSSSLLYSYTNNPHTAGYPVQSAALPIAALLNSTTGVISPSLFTAQLSSVSVPPGGTSLQFYVNGTNVAGQGPPATTLFNVASCASPPASLQVSSVSPTVISVSFPVSVNPGGNAAVVQSYSLSWALLPQGGASAAQVAAGTGSALLLPGAVNVTVSGSTVTAVVASSSLISPPPGPGYLFNFSLSANNQFGGCTGQPQFTTYDVVNVQSDQCCFAFSSPSYPTLTAPTAAQLSAASHNGIVLDPTNPIALYNGLSLSTLTAPTCYAVGNSPLQYYNSATGTWLSTYTGSDGAQHNIVEFALGEYAGSVNPYQNAFVNLQTPLASYAGTGGAALFSAVSGKPLRLNVECNLRLLGSLLGVCGLLTECMTSCAAFTIGSAVPFNVSYSVAQSTTCAKQVTAATTATCPWPGIFC